MRVSHSISRDSSAGEVDLCGLPASVASWSLALIGLFRQSSRGLLDVALSQQATSSRSCMRRALRIAWYLTAPKPTWTFYVSAIGLGLTWLSAVAPTATIVGKLFGVRYLATLFSLTLLAHQIGGYLGAYLGGLAIAHSGNYHRMWYADAALAGLATVVNLTIREAPIGRLAAA
jgi:hypothetical protein